MEATHETQEEIFDASLKTVAESFDEQMRSKYPPTVYKQIRTIGAFIANGSSLEDACILALIDPENFLEIMKIDPNVRAFVRYKETAHKAKLLKTITQSAADGNVKAAGYLLEQKHRDEFGKRAADDDRRDPDDIERALEFIRESGDTTPIALPSSRPAPSVAQNLPTSGVLPS